LNPEPLIAALSASPNTKLYVFTKSYYQNRWVRYTQPTDGETFVLTDSAEQMYNDLMSILDEICLPEDRSTRILSVESNGYQMARLRARYDFEIGICY